jgi:hypothetical protein
MEGGVSHGRLSSFSFLSNGNACPFAEKLVELVAALRQTTADGIH